MFILKRNANIYIYKQYLETDITPKFEDKKIKNTSWGSKYTQQKIQRIRIKGEQIFL
jgi:hypothetical protein